MRKKNCSVNFLHGFDIKLRNRSCLVDRSVASHHATVISLGGLVMLGHHHLSASWQLNLGINGLSILHVVPQLLSLIQIRRVIVLKVRNPTLLCILSEYKWHITNTLVICTIIDKVAQTYMFNDLAIWNVLCPGLNVKLWNHWMIAWIPWYSKDMPTKITNQRIVKGFYWDYMMCLWKLLLCDLCVLCIKDNSSQSKIEFRKKNQVNFFLQNFVQQRVKREMFIFLCDIIW